MTKGQLIESLCEVPELGLTKRAAEHAVNIIFESMTEALVAGHRIEIRGLGSFKVKERMPRVARRDHRTGPQAPARQARLQPPRFPPRARALHHVRAPQRP